MAAQWALCKFDEPETASIIKKFAMMMNVAVLFRFQVQETTLKRLQPPGCGFGDVGDLDLLI